MISEQIGALAQDAAKAFRLGMEGQASEWFIALIDLLPEFLQTATAADFNRWQPLLAHMVIAQDGKDYLYLADLLEYNLIPLVGAQGVRRLSS